MKISFDNSSIEIKKQEGKILIMISAVDYTTPNKYIINTAELTQEQFNEVIKEIQNT